MDISSILGITAVVLCLGVPSHQKPQEAALVETSSTANVTDNVDPAPVAQNCTTAKGLNGTCIQRQSCDHSTFAIDLTLYAPRWYKRPCALDEVCCPFNALVLVDPQADYQEDNFNSDNDANENNDNDDDNDFLK